MDNWHQMKLAKSKYNRLSNSTVWRYMNNTQLVKEQIRNVHVPRISCNVDRTGLTIDNFGARNTMNIVD